MTHDSELLQTNGAGNQMKQTENTEIQCENTKKIENEPPKDKVQSALTHEELIEYMYQHIQFDEMPFDNDPLCDHRQIYTHETAHIEYGLYENIEASAAFSFQIQQGSQ